MFLRPRPWRWWRWPGLVGVATEQLGESSGPKVGGVLNATFGNAAELIITIFAIRAGQLEVATASITGSILGNTLLVLGASFCHRRHPPRHCRRSTAAWRA